MFIGVFELFSEGERKKKRFKRYASSDALVWTGENKTPGWAKILCFVFVEILKGFNVHYCGRSRVIIQVGVYCLICTTDGIYFQLKVPLLTVSLQHKVASSVNTPPRGPTDNAEKDVRLRTANALFIYAIERLFLQCLWGICN